jgi:hypothetical protein
MPIGEIGTSMLTMKAHHFIVGLPAGVSSLAFAYLYGVDHSAALARTCASADGLGCAAAAMAIGVVVVAITILYVVLGVAMNNINRSRANSFYMGAAVNGVVSLVLFSVLIGRT